MTDSSAHTAAKTPAEQDKRGFLEKVAAGEFLARDYNDYTHPSQIPRWAKIAIARKELLGATWNESVEGLDRAGQSAMRYGNCPAGKILREQMREFVDDPVQLAQFVLRSNVHEIAIDYMGVIEAAKAAGDYKEVRLAAKDILKTYDVIKDQTRNADALGAPMIIHIDLGSAHFEVPEVKTTHKVIEIVAEDDDDE